MDSDIKAAVNAVAAYAAGRYKRELVRKINEQLEPEILRAQLSGDEIDTSELFLRLAEKYAN